MLCIVNQYFIVSRLKLSCLPARVIEFNLKFALSVHQFGWSQVDTPQLWWSFEVHEYEIGFVCIYMQKFDYYLGRQNGSQLLTFCQEISAYC